MSWNPKPLPRRVYVKVVPLATFCQGQDRLWRDQKHSHLAIASVKEIFRWLLSTGHYLWVMSGQWDSRTRASFEHSQFPSQNMTWNVGLPKSGSDILPPAQWESRCEVPTAESKQHWSRAKSGWSSHHLKTMINDNDMTALTPVKQFLASTLSGRKQAQPKKN